MFDPSRYRGPAAAIAAVGLALAGCSLVVAGGIPGEAVLVVRGRLDDGRGSGRRGRPADLRGARRAETAGESLVRPRSRRRPRLVGRRHGDRSEAARSSEDPRNPARWLSLYANGAHLGDLSGLAELLLGERAAAPAAGPGAPPRVAGQERRLPLGRRQVRPSPLLAGRQGRRLRDAEDEFLLLMSAPLNAAFPERTRIGHGSRVLVIGAKRRMFARLGMGAESLYAPDPDPWTVRLLMPDPEDVPRRAEEAAASASVRELNEGVRLRGLRAGARDKGWFDRANYSTEGYNARSLVAIVREARGAGRRGRGRVAPESSAMRAAVPAEAMDCLRAVLRDAFGPARLRSSTCATPSPTASSTTMSMRHRGPTGRDPPVDRGPRPSPGPDDCGARREAEPGPGRGGAGRNQDAQTFHGACPDVQRPSSSLRSRSVSMHCQNSPCR